VTLPFAVGAGQERCRSVSVSCVAGEWTVFPVRHYLNHRALPPSGQLVAGDRVGGDVLPSPSVMVRDIAVRF